MTARDEHAAENDASGPDESPTVTDYLRAIAEAFGLDPDEVEHAHLLATNRVIPPTSGDAR